PAPSYLRYVVDAVVSGSSSGGAVYAFHARDGSLLWRWSLPHAPPGILPISAVVDGAVYVSAPDGTTLYVLRTSNGSVLWHYTAQLPEPQSSLLPVVADGITYIIVPDESL